MSEGIESIPLDRLIEHPDNPNRMSSASFGRLVRNIERSGRYEPLVVRPHPKRIGCYQIINGHHRARALAKLGRAEAQAVVWDVDDEQVLVLLATLNRLSGSDVLDKKITLLARLTANRSAAELSKLLPQTAKQIERLTDLKLPKAPATPKQEPFATPMVLFLSSEQKQTVERALAIAADPKTKPKPARNAAAMTTIAQQFINQQ